MQRENELLRGLISSALNRLSTIQNTIERLLRYVLIILLKVNHNLIII